jgi:uncharacterized protein (DUF2252 family)
MARTLVTGGEKLVAPLTPKNGSGRLAGWPGTRSQRPSSRQARSLLGRGLRAEVPRTSHAVWEPPPDRTDPVQLLTADAEGRIEDLLPVRNGRMLSSPFAFFRGSASVMAADLAVTPTTGIEAQLCGDAHLSNFGGYASPDRNLVFDLNDFDETLPGPWEWDVKRLATSLEIAGRDRGFDERERHEVVRAASAAYRDAMRAFAQLSALDVWYSRLTVKDIRERWGDEAGAKAVRKFDKQVQKAMTRDSASAANTLTRLVDGRAQIISDAPLVVPVSELLTPEELHALDKVVTDTLRSYRRSLTASSRRLLEQFHYGDAARKVVGVGSVGTRSWVLLMTGLDGEPLMLQLKEASDSALAPFAGRTRFTNQGQRVVVGQQLLQASSDILLGWTRAPALDGVTRDFYVRQLWDWKLSADVEKQAPSTMAIYARMCGWTLARGHARSGDRCAIAAYLGGGDVFDVAMTDFAQAYAEQNESDYREFMMATQDGRVDVAWNL